MRKKKVRHLVTFLMRQDVSNFESVLKDHNKVLRFPLNSGVGCEGVVFFAKDQFRTPQWLSFLQSGTDSQLPTIQSEGASAVLVVRQDGRLFAITFGTGRHLLDQDCFVSDFGLKVALNCISPTKIRSMDTKIVSELTLNTRRQSSHSSSLNTFGIDPARDLLKAVTGEPRESAFAKRITGKDALILTAEMDFEDIGCKCANMLTEYQSDTYKEYFSWIDHLREVRTPSIVKPLDDHLVAALQAGDTSRIHIAAPEVLDNEEHLSYGFDVRSPKEVVDLTIEGYLDEVGDPSKLTLGDLRSHKVIAGHDVERPSKRWKLYDCIVFEASLGAALYVLSGGHWFKVDQAFASTIHGDLAQIPESSVYLPPAAPGETEPHYNQRVADGNSTLAYLDAKTIHLKNRTAVEACDLYTRSKQFVHIKRQSRSSTLSHLFAQGMVSGELFKEDRSFREELRKKMAMTRPTFAATIPDTRPQASNYEVVFAILMKGNRADLLSLPFFTQVHLLQAVKYLRSLDYQVTYRLIPEQAADAGPHLAQIAPSKDV